MSSLPIRGFSLALLTFALALGTFIQVLDTSIATVAVPTIAGNLAVSSNDGTWIITSFSVSNAVVLPLTGWLSSQFGVVRLFSFSTALFGVTSWLCGAAWSLPSLIFFRVLQGAVAGSLIPLSQTLLLNNYPKEKQGMALALWTMVVVVAPVVGPVVGGWIVEYYPWGWIFYINVPLAFISSAMTWRLLKDRESETVQKPMDITGLCLLIISVSTLQIALDKGNDWDWLNSHRIVALAIIFVISSIFFFIWNKNSPDPVIDFNYFTYRNFNLSTLLVTIGFVLYFAGTVLLPLWLQDFMGYTPLWAGIAVMPTGIPPILTSLLVSKMMEKGWDPRWLVTFSFVVFGYTYYLMTNLMTEVDVAFILWMRFWQGFAISFFFMPLVKMALFDFTPEKMAGATGIFNFVRLLFGGGIGTSLSVTFFSRRTQLFHSDVGEFVYVGHLATDQFYAYLQQMNIAFDTATVILNHSVTQQASTICINNYFLLSSVLFFASIPLIWLCKTSPKKTVSK